MVHIQVFSKPIAKGTKEFLNVSSASGEDEPATRSVQLEFTVQGVTEALV